MQPARTQRFATNCYSSVLCLFAFFRINVSLGETEERSLMTGMHTVADIYCNVCNSVLGWKYVRARPHAQRRARPPVFAQHRR